MTEIQLNDCFDPKTAKRLLREMQKASRQKVQAWEAVIKDCLIAAYGSYDKSLGLQVFKTAGDFALYVSMLTFALEKPLLGVNRGSMGQKKVVTLPILTDMEKVTKVLSEDLRALGLNANSTLYQLRIAKVNAEGDSVIDFMKMTLTAESIERMEEAEG